MNNITKKLYADILREEESVCFWYKKCYFISIENHSEFGFNVDVYTNDIGCFISDDKQELIFVDGGHCESDKEIDAIEFMLDEAVGKDDWLI